MLDQWFAPFPNGEVARDLRNRFRKDDHAQHYAAWWELYLYTFLTRSGFEVEVHPILHGSGDRPDFLVRSPRGRFYVEAATTFSGIDDGERHSPLEAQIMDVVETVLCETFTISFGFERIGTEMPSVREILGPIQEWLNGLDPDEVLRTSVYPRRCFSIRDWELELLAYPLEAAHRGPVDQLIAVGPGMVGSVNDTERLRATLDRKRSKYGDLQAPLLIAVLMPSTFADLDAVEKALFGDVALQYYVGERGRERWVRRRNGFWLGERGPRARSVSGVVTGFGILPSADIATKLPRFWPNPWATRPLAESLDMPRSVGTTEAQFDHQDEDAFSPRTLLDLSPEWPGPEPPFLE